MLTKPLRELTDSELMLLLDCVSDEVKRRNSIIPSDLNIQQATTQVLNNLVDLITKASSQSK